MPYYCVMARPGFPRTLREFRRQFSSDAACLEYLAQSRWPEGFICPKCGGKKYWVIKEPFGYECGGCGRRTSPMAGTAMHRSHVGIQGWFWAAYLVATHTPGFSAKQLEPQIGCQYKTAWFMLHRLRRAMVNDARSRLAGSVEADETIVGGPVRGKRGRAVTDLTTKTLVFGAVEVIGYTDTSTGRALRRLAASAWPPLQRPILMQNVEEVSMIRNDGWRGYSKTAQAKSRNEGFAHPPGFWQSQNVAQWYSSWSRSKVFAGLP